MTAPTPDIGGVVVDPRFRQRRIAVRRQAGRRRLRRLVVLALVAALALATVVVLRSPILDVDEVSVVGARFTGPEVVHDAVHVDIGSPLLLADLDAARRRIEALPWVAEAEVTRDLPGSIRVRITERTPAALVATAGVTALVDDEGRVLATGDPSTFPGRTPAGPAFVSVIAPGTDPPEVGGRVGRDLLDAIALAGRLQTNPAGAVADVRIDPSLRLGLVAGGTVELGDTTELDAKVEAFRTVHARVDLTCLDSIDVRVPTRPVLTRSPRCS